MRSSPTRPVILVPVFASHLRVSALLTLSYSLCLARFVLLAPPLRAPVFASHLHAPACASLPCFLAQRRSFKVPFPCFSPKVSLALPFTTLSVCPCPNALASTLWPQRSGLSTPAPRTATCNSHALHRCAFPAGSPCKPAAQTRSSQSRAEPIAFYLLLFQVFARASSLRPSQTVIPNGTGAP